jgi:hypothetical protein
MRDVTLPSRERLELASDWYCELFAEGGLLCIYISANRLLRLRISDGPMQHVDAPIPAFSSKRAHMHAHAYAPDDITASYRPALSMK